MPETKGKREERPGWKLASVTWIWVVGIYLQIAALAVLVAMVMLWPYPTPSMSHDDEDHMAATAPTTTTDTAPATPPAATETQRHPRKIVPGPGVRGVPGFFYCAAPDSAREFWRYHEDDVMDPQCVNFPLLDPIPISNEQRLLLLVLFAGALGAFVRAFQSYHWYVGHRMLRLSWIPMYFILPWIGGLLGVVFYVIVRGGFFSPSSDFSQTSPFGFAAAAFLVGLFSDQALEKLKQVATTFFGEKPRGKESAPQSGSRQKADTATSTGAPAVTTIETRLMSGGAETNELEIIGTGFSTETEVMINNERRKTANTATSIRVPLTPDEVRIIDTGGDLTLIVQNPGPTGGAASFTVPRD